MSSKSKHYLKRITTCEMTAQEKAALRLAVSILVLARLFTVVAHCSDNDV